MLDRRESGHTLLEIMIVITILAVIIYLTHEGIDAGVRVNDQMQRTNRLHILGHDILSRIERDISRSHRVFTEGDDARDLIDRFEGAGAGILTNSLLPVGDSDGILQRDTVGDRKTGNFLMFAASLPPIAVDVGSPTPNVVRVDLYRYVVYHLAVHKDYSADAPQSELVRWSSRPIANYTQVMKVTDSADRGRLTQALEDIGVVALWDSTADVMDDAFYPIDLGAASSTPDATFEIPRDPIGSNAGFSGNKRAGLAQDATKAPGARIFAPSDSTMPQGFEIKMIGPASARQVFVNITMVAYQAGRNPILLRRSIIVGARDM